MSRRRSVTHACPMSEIMGVVAWVVAGLIAGWLAGVTMKGGYGRIGDLAVGLIGAFAGAWLFVFFASDPLNAVAWGIVVSATGAVAFVALARVLTRAAARELPTVS